MPDDETADAFLARCHHDPAGAKRELRRRDVERHRRLILAGAGLRVEGINYWPQADDTGRNRSKPRHRPPDGIPVAAVRKLETLLARRRRAGRPTQEEIAAEVERVARETAPQIRFDHNRVQQAEGLQRLGWGLLRSQPEFSADDGFVYWPTVAKAAKILDLQRQG